MSLLFAPLSQVIACGSGGDEETESEGGAAGWASGGTAAMTAASTYPDVRSSTGAELCEANSKAMDDLLASGADPNDPSSWPE